ncbi:MAG TPA: PLD nuclease N-terminal domain-containing protein [Acidobacteriaceae bacterium]|nr:PLD nuclease N-terminal domain-containing protein [Acidobacteriaceae bacterium]
MKIHDFMSNVPQGVKRGALAVAGCAVLIGLAMGYHAVTQGAAVRTMFLDSAASLIFGMLAAAWILCLGFVFADARQRAMRPVLWVLVAALFPHLLGFLLYFVLRQPIASTCAHCGQRIPMQQPFCSWCGNPQTRDVSGGARMGVELCQDGK